MKSNCTIPLTNRHFQIYLFFLLKFGVLVWGGKKPGHKVEELERIYGRGGNLELSEAGEQQLVVLWVPFSYLG